jgi:hypothetical protein
MKATTSIRQPLLLGDLIILLVGFLSFSFNALAAKNNAKLSQVFTSEAAPNDKQVLKLYDDNSYEFLHFVIEHKKPKVIREQGSYVLESNKLKLKSRNKKGVIDHPKHYFFLSEKGLFKSRAQAKKVNALPALATNKDSKYYEVFYIDSVFGKVSNDPKVFNKLADTKLKEKPKEIINPITEVKRDTLGNYEYLKSALYKNIRLSVDTLRMIKAVIVVGNDAKDFIGEQKKVAAFLKGLGVNVTELYWPNAKWEDVKKASENANIFLYSGHGGTDPTSESAKEGTMYLNEGVISGSNITESLKLHKNALVLFSHACESAGSSALDTKDIGVNEATKRVEDYAKPFVKLGAACYYSNNYNDYVIPLLTKFFNGTRIKDIYNSDATKWDVVANRKIYAYNKKYEAAIAISKTANEYTQTMYKKGKPVEVKLKPFKSYDVAYVGVPTFTVHDLFN